MERAEEVRLLGELRDLANEKRCFAVDPTSSNAVAKYTAQARFDSEYRRVMRPLPQIVAHRGELPGADSFLRRDILGSPALLTRDDSGEVHAFLNVCRHRGTRLVDDESGCRGRFSCPYHAWTWNNRGELLKIPFGEEGFPEADPQELGLVRLYCVERYGWIWAAPDGSRFDLDELLGGLQDDLAWLAAEQLEIKATETSERAANWKILIEGGLEAYHFRVVHRKTVGPHLANNLSSYQCFGDNLRSVLPRAAIGEVDLTDAPASQIREHANILYTIFPLSQILVVQDHLIWIREEPLAPGLTRMHISTMAPAGDAASEHWERNQGITTETLREDGDIAESIQSGIHAGANTEFRFGRFEGALARFNAAVDRYVAA